MHYQQAMDDFLLYLEVEQNYSSNTIRSYEYDLTVFRYFLEKHKRSTDLSDLNSSIVRRFVQDQMLNYKSKSRTMQRRISSLKSFCSYCLKEQLMTSDFMAGIKAPKSDSKLPVYMNMEELKKLFSFLEHESHPLALRNETMFKLLATTGIRRQELVDLTWEQIDFYNGTVLIFGKGKKERLLPLHSMMLPLLKKHKESLKEYQTHPQEPIFLNKNGKVLNPRGLHLIFKEVLKKAGLPPRRFSLHHLRHTFATLLLQQVKAEKVDEYGNVSYTPQEKVDLRTLQELLGHESLATTQVYTHIDFESKKKAIDSFRFS
ncbi:tyrosine-type recombinase/integrase [Cytobacillus depressus]|uniref:Tyrosine-type recombinase/integrase n=1 Tax=Cytobacillus depressus TaxID=1602942 RepID=A0A6L3V2T7_9BACI|nr:tyrosine-type recombinase/integrase [Cytobacillus depressus]KAB2331501.1 tyrosine-type recombinase/integrase [Cytobacillus depressus]